MINAWPWWKVKSNFPIRKSWLNSCVRDQFEIQSLIVCLINTAFHFLCVKKIELEPAIIWKVVTCQRITSKNSNSVGWYLSPRYGQVMIVSGCCSLTAVNWTSLEWRILNKRVLVRHFSLGCNGGLMGRNIRSCIWALVVSDLIVYHFDSCQLTLIWVARITLNFRQPTDYPGRWKWSFISFSSLCQCDILYQLICRGKWLISYLSSRDGHVITVSGCLILTAVNSFPYGWLTKC